MSFKTLEKEEKEILPFLMDHVPEYFQRKCEEELNETPEIKSVALKELRSMLQENQTTSGIDFLDDHLVRFLRRHKYSTKQAMKMIENCANIGRKYEYLMESIPDNYFQLTSSTKSWCVLPKRCPDGCTIVLTRTALWNPEEFPIEHYKQMVAMIFSQLTRDPMTQINGVKFIHDFGGTSFQHLKYATPQTIYLFHQCTVNSVPFRYKAIHLLHKSVLLKTVWDLLKPFLSQKMKNRVHFHSNGEELLDYFPRSVLPVEYGGELTDFDNVDWIRKANKDHDKYTAEGKPNYY